jgi:hydrogenase nickel incorporation protein HypA/HybF
VHEMGIMAGILESSFEAAERADAQRITEIRITVGELTEIQEFALDFAFMSMTPGTIAEGAKLVVNTVAPSSRCRDCGLEYAHDRFEMICPSCGSFNVEPLTGRELRIDSIAADDGEGASAEDAVGDPDLTADAPEE